MRGLLQGNATHTGAEAVHNALLELHATYQDLSFAVNIYAEEEGRVALFWTATGTNRVGLFGMPPTYKRSTFSGVSMVYLTPEGLIREVVEYRQPTHEEMSAHLRRDLPGAQRAAIDRLLLRGHAAPPRGAEEQEAVLAASSSYYCQLPASREVDPMWRVRAVRAATEWVENWTPGPDLEDMVRPDMEEYNMYSWPDFEEDVIGRDALEERRSRDSHDAVVIRETVADSTTNVVAVHWYDFEQQVPGHTAAAAVPVGAVAAAKAAAAAGVPLPERALPREQPTLHPEHGSVEMRNGGLRVHLGANRSRGSLGSEDEASLGAPAPLHKFRGVTLFRLDDDCKLAWQVSFREMKATELDTYLNAKGAAAAAGVRR